MLFGVVIGVLLLALVLASALARWGLAFPHFGRWIDRKAYRAFPHLGHLFVSNEEAEEDE